MAVDAPGAWEEESASASDNAISALGKICKVHIHTHAHIYYIYYI